MTNPNQPSVPRYVAGAIDLGELKAQAEARRHAEELRNSPQAASSAAGISPVVAVSAENFENDVVRRSLQVPVIVAVTSPRSPQAEQLADDLESLAREGNLSWIFARVNADTDGDVAQAFGVRAIPTVIVLAGGRPVTNFEGGQPKEALKGFIDQVLSTLGSQLPGIPDSEREGQAQAGQEPTDPRIVQAQEATGMEQWDEAIALYDQVLADDPGNVEVKKDRDYVAIFRRVAHSRDTWGNVNRADIPEPDRTLYTADELVINGQEAQAYALLIDLVRTGTSEQKTAAKDHLLELLSLADPSDDTVIAARRDLASALF